MESYPEEMESASLPNRGIQRWIEMRIGSDVRHDWLAAFRSWFRQSVLYAEVIKVFTGCPVRIRDGAERRTSDATNFKSIAPLGPFSRREMKNPRPQILA
jgi:hypothetical protein